MLLFFVLFAIAFAFFFVVTHIAVRLAVATAFVIVFTHCADCISRIVIAITARLLFFAHSKPPFKPQPLSLFSFFLLLHDTRRN
jgi:hypothetical protein